MVVNEGLAREGRSGLRGTPTGPNHPSTTPFKLMSLRCLIAAIFRTALAAISRNKKVRNFLFWETLFQFTDNPKIYRVCPRIYRLRSKIYRVFPHFAEDNSTFSKEKEQQKEKTMSSTPSPHGKQLQLDEGFGRIQLMWREQRVASRVTQVSLRPVNACRQDHDDGATG